MLLTCPYLATTAPVADAAAEVAVVLDGVTELDAAVVMRVVDAEAVVEAGVLPDPEPAVHVATGPPGAV